MKIGNIWDDFEWPVLSDYKWRETPVGLALIAAPGATVIRRYRPLSKEFAGLYRDFARLDASPEAVLRFACEYGSLGPPVRGALLRDTVSELNPDELQPGSLAAIGFEAITGGPENLIEPFDWQPDAKPRCWKSQIVAMDAFTRWLQERVSRTKGQPANMREAVEGVTTMVLMRKANDVLAATVAPRLSHAADGTSLRFRFEPRSLLGALWLQAAQSAAEGLTYRQCASCERPIAIARTTGARADAKFCSDACKSRNYRERRYKAIELDRKGWTPRRIAQKLGTTTKSVRGWIR